MKREEKRKAARDQERKYRHIQNKKMITTVYILLRVSVILTMIAQIFNGNYENVYICVLVLVLFMLPSIIERKLHIDLPDTLEIIVLLFIYAAEILGEIQEYYVFIPFWDDLLHTLNGFLFAAIGFSLVNILNRDRRVTVHLSPFYMAAMAFCFSMTIGVLWEFFEWGVDSLFHSDMQKDTVVHLLNSVSLNPEGRNIPFHLKNITDVIIVQADGSQHALGLGGYLDIGLIDTMTDLLVNFIGAVVFSIIGFFYVKSQGKGKLARLFIPQVMESAPYQPDSLPESPAEEEDDLGSTE